MVEIASSGSGEGPASATGRGYSTAEFFRLGHEHHRLSAVIRGDRVLFTPPPCGQLIAELVNLLELLEPGTAREAVAELLLRVRDTSRELAGRLEHATGHPTELADIRRYDIPDAVSEFKDELVNLGPLHRDVQELLNVPRPVRAAVHRGHAFLGMSAATRADALARMGTDVPDVLDSRLRQTVGPDASSVPPAWHVLLEDWDTAQIRRWYNEHGVRFTQRYEFGRPDAWVIDLPIAASIPRAHRLLEVHGIVVPEWIVFRPSTTPIEHGWASYGGLRVPDLDTPVRWRDLADSAGRVIVHVDPRVLRSQEAIVAVLSHEILELRRLRRLIGDGSMRAEQVLLETMGLPEDAVREAARSGRLRPGQTAHGTAARAADRLTERMRATSAAERRSE